MRHISRTQPKPPHSQLKTKISCYSPFKEDNVTKNMVLYHWSCFFRLKPKTQLAKKNCQQVKKKKLYPSKGNDVFNCRRSNENRFSEVRFLNCSMFMGPKSWVELTPPRPGQLGGSGEDLIRLNSSELKKPLICCIGSFDVHY